MLPEYYHPMVTEVMAANPNLQSPVTSFFCLIIKSITSALLKCCLMTCASPEAIINPLLKPHCFLMPCWVSPPPDIKVAQLLHKDKNLQMQDSLQLCVEGLICIIILFVSSTPVLYTLSCLLILTAPSQLSHDSQYAFPLLSHSPQGRLPVNPKRPKRHTHWHQSTHSSHESETVHMWYTKSYKYSGEQWITFRG